MQKVIIITGASSGIGKDAALQLIKEGHIVYGAARRIEQMKDIEDSGGYRLQMDVTDVNQIKSAVNKVIKEQGRIDVLFNNADMRYMVLWRRCLSKMQNANLM